MLNPTSAETPRAFNYRKLFWKWHQYAGWFGGPLLILIAVTGAILVFSPEIDRLLRPDLWTITPPSAGVLQATVSDQAMVDSVRRAFPSERIILYRQNEHPNEPYQFLLFGKPAQGIHDVWVNPYNGELVGDRMRETAFVRIVEQLHRRLLTGEIGSSIIELITGWAIVLTITGCYLWWPKTWKLLWHGLTLSFRGSAYKVNWRLHNTVGAWVALVVLLLCLTGMVFSTFSGGMYFQLMRRTGAADNPLNQPPKSGPAKGRLPVPVDQILALAANGLPPETPLGIQMPSTADGSFVVMTLRDERPVWADRKGFCVWAFDQYSGEKLATFAWDDFHPLMQFRMFSISLHYGAIFGLPTKLIALAACLTVPVLSVTGYLIWWWKRKSKQQAAARQGTRLAEPAADSPQVAPVSRWLIGALILAGIVFPTIGASYLLLLTWEGIRHLGRTSRTASSERTPAQTL